VFGDSLQGGARQIDEDFWFCFCAKKKRVVYYYQNEERAKKFLLEIL
jgi:hypothetical protein